MSSAHVAAYESPHFIPEGGYLCRQQRQVKNTARLLPTPTGHAPLTPVCVDGRLHWTPGFSGAPSQLERNILISVRIL